MLEQISNDDLELSLDNYINNGKNTKAEELLIIMYVLQLFYRSGKRFTNNEEVHTKYHLLVNDRLVDSLKKDGMIEEFSDAKTGEPVYFLKEQDHDKV